MDLNVCLLCAATATGGVVRRGEVKVCFQPTLLQLISLPRSNQKFVSVYTYTVGLIMQVFFCLPCLYDDFIAVTLPLPFYCPFLLESVNILGLG